MASCRCRPAQEGQSSSSTSQRGTPAAAFCSRAPGAEDRNHSICKRGVRLLRLLRTLSSTRARIVRALLAVMLALAVLASAAPPEIVSAGHHCSMPCCQSARGERGGCAEGSCHVDLSNLAKPAKLTKPVKSAKLVESDPVCGAEKLLSRLKAVPPVRLVPAASEPPHGHLGHDSIEHGEAVAQPSQQHESGRHGTTPQMRAAAVSKPCAPGCGSAATSFTQLRRTRDAAALSFKLRPRPPSSSIRAREDERHTYASSAWRRPCRPRGPPHTFS